MTMQSVGGSILIPEYCHYSFTARDYTVDVDGETCGGVFRIPKTGKLHKIGIRTATVGTPDTITVRLETVDATTGYPTGTLYSTSPASSGTQESPEANTTYWVPLNGSTGIDVTVNDIVAVVIGRVNGSGSINIRNNIVVGAYSFPYAYTYVPTTFTKVNEQLNIGLEYDAIIYCHGMYPASSGAAISSTWNDADFKKGLCFQVAYKTRINGVTVMADTDNDAEVILYDSDQATAVQTWSIDKDVRSGVTHGYYRLPLSTVKTLSVNTKYRLVIQPSSGAAITYTQVTVMDDGELPAMAGMPCGVNWHYTECNGTPANEASWTDTLTARPLFGIIVDQFDDGAGTGGGGRPEIRGNNL